MKENFLTLSYKFTEVADPNIEVNFLFIFFPFLDTQTLVLVNMKYSCVI